MPVSPCAPLLADMTGSLVEAEVLARAEQMRRVLLPPRRRVGVRGLQNLDRDQRFDGIARLALDLPGEERDEQRQDTPRPRQNAAGKKAPRHRGSTRER